MATAGSAEPVLPDTSVWIDYFRGVPGVVARMADLMDQGRIRVLPLIIGELVRGVRKEKDVAPILDLGKVFPVLDEPDGAWVSAGLLCLRMRGKGYFPGLGDAYVATCAFACRVAVWTGDEHFAQIRDHGGVPLRRLATIDLPSEDATAEADGERAHSDRPSRSSATVTEGARTQAARCPVGASVTGKAISISRLRLL